MAQHPDPTHTEKAHADGGESLRSRSCDVSLQRGRASQQEAAVVYEELHPVYYCSGTLRRDASTWAHSTQATHRSHDYTCLSIQKCELNLICCIIVSFQEVMTG